MAYVRTRLGRLFYEERGETRHSGDPAIVLLHGFLFDGGMWRGQLEALEALGRVVVIDGPGHGKSEPGPRFSLEEHADAIHDVLGELGIHQACLVGLSWGGMISMRFALQHPRQTAGIALLNTSAEVHGLVERVRGRVFLALHRRVGFPFRLFRSQVARQMFADKTIREQPELILASYRRGMRFDRDGVSRAGHAVLVRRTHILHRLGAISCPALVLCGREDQLFPVAMHERLANAIPGAELAVVDDVGHLSALECPDRVNAVLVPFLKRVLARE